MPRVKKKETKNNFFNDVYEVVKLIPKGRVTSYGAIGNYLGVKSSARMVGWAMFGCPRGIPAHRVVNSAGLLTGKHHFSTPHTMQNQKFQNHFLGPFQRIVKNLHADLRKVYPNKG
jgi:methylated-DNA-protein-cysteine methyltransferase-like protein